MKVTLSFEESVSRDVSIVVDALRASTTITMAFNNFKHIIPTFSPDIARNIAKDCDGVLVGERLGVKLEGFDIGNSPEKVMNYETNKDTMVITTTNGTRILESIDSKVLVGSFVNAKSVASSALNIADEHIDLVMAGRKGNFAIEDYLACGEILYWINTLGEDIRLSEYSISSILASRDIKKSNEAILNSSSAKILEAIGYINDVKFSIQRNITDNVGFYENGELILLD